jgi:hypothetical protein
VPTTSDLQLGEIAVNTFDGKMYIKKDNGTSSVVEIGGASGSGTVTSVGIIAGTGVTSSGGPITTSGNITVGLSAKLTAIENLSGAGFFTQNGSGAIARRTLQAGTGISVAHGNGSSQDPVITNSAPDQIVALASGTGISVTGTYPNFTVTNTSPNVGSGTVTSVGGTGTVNGLTLTGTVTTSGNLTLGGTLSGTASGLTVGAATTATTATTANALNSANSYTATKFIGGSNANPAIASNYGLQASGAYGGGVSLLDGANAIGLYSTTGTLNFGFGASATTIASKATLTAAGAFTAVSFSGAGTGLTGTASGLSIGGNAANVTGTVAQANGGTGFTTGYRLFQSEFTTNINANTNRTVGAYGSYASAATNTPTTSGILYNFTSGSDGSGDGGQFWQDYVTNNLYLRQRWGGSYSGWTQFLTTTGNATNIGDLTDAPLPHGYWPGALSSSTRGVFAGGDSGSATIDYVTIATTGNATNFGNLTAGRDGLSGCSNATRGLFAQGFDGVSAFLNTIDYVTIATTGNAIDFGDCSTGSRGSSSMSGTTRAVINVGSSSNPYASNIDFEALYNLNKNLIYHFRKQ